MKIKCITTIRKLKIIFEYAVLHIIYVTECDSNTVCMFSTSGRFIGYMYVALYNPSRKKKFYTFVSYDLYSVCFTHAATK